MKKQATAIKLVEAIVRKHMRSKLTESVSKDALNAYLAAAIETSSNEDELMDATVFDFSNKARSSAMNDINAFIEKLKSANLYDSYMVDGDEESLAHDFWMTRSGTGASFSDRRYSKQGLGKAIDAIAYKFRNDSQVVMGDDGKLYFE